MNSLSRDERSAWPEQEKAVLQALEEAFALSARGGLRRLLVAGIGNIFLGDDGFGCTVAQRARGRYPLGVEVVDFGIRGLELAYALLDGYEALILIDAVPRGGSPGTLYLLKPLLPPADQAADLAAGKLGLEAHSLDPVRILTYARALGAPPIPTLLIGCEPAPLADDADEEELQMGLSPPVQGAVERALCILDTVVRQLCQGSGSAETV
ncbi:hydrogenase maturation protease [Thermogemmatispora carboxidivorans]|uniref:hydrogenase maturation protease n=1 Tax=Thermogemmatispora carboxidivorans TaxID=1382306 RepID=UPI0009DCF874|nr:hydrogenase maturation protease [Thermogemmatispora carboxidivorans]